MFIYINISNIILDRTPIDSRTLNLAIKIKNKIINPKSLPLITVMINGKGNYLVQNRRHRICACKMNNIKQIKAKINQLQKYITVRR